MYAMIYDLNFVIMFRHTVLVNTPIWWWPTAMVGALFWCSCLITIAFVWQTKDLVCNVYKPTTIQKTSRNGTKL